MNTLRSWVGAAHRTPPGYRPGALLEKVRADLRGLESVPVSDTCVRFRCSDPSLEFTAEERVEPQFLMHIVTTRFSCSIPGRSDGHRALRIRHSGKWKRSGIDCIAGDDANETTRDLARRLTQHPDLGRSMLPLDFTDCELQPTPHGWTACVTHYGASEVVYRVPPIRQYIRYPREQLQTLLQTFAALKNVLAA